MLVLPILAALGCEPLSATREGRDDAVRYQLPPNAIAILEDADSLELFALGDEPRGDGEAPSASELFARRPVLGRAQVHPDEHRFVAAALYRAISRGSGQALCFEPHHGLRARLGRDVLELAICYSCWQMEIVGHDGPNVALATSELEGVIDPIIERSAGLRFERDSEHSHGSWVARNAD